MSATPHRVLSRREIQERAQSDEQLIKEPSCLKCAHMPVCSIYRAIAPLINSFETPNANTDTRPFKPEELAKICKYYAPPEVALLSP